MNKRLKTLLGWLLSPAAIGIYVTIAVSWLCFLFYALRDSGNKDRAWVTLLLKAHQSSVDFRFQSRGPQKGSSEVAVLAVDERAVETVGRWPWPREVIAKAMEHAFQNGAKVLAFDIVWSEPTENLGLKIYDKLHTNHSLSADVDRQLLEDVHTHDGDQALADVYAKNSDHIVAGSQFLGEIDNPQSPGYLDFCYNLAFKRTAAAALWDHEEMLISPTDPYQADPPHKLMEVFTTILQAREEAVRSQSGKHELSRKEQYDLDVRVAEDLKDACRTILDDYKDEIESLWQSEIRPNENPAEFKFNTYKEWVTNFKQHYRYANAVPVAENWVMDIPLIADKTKNTAYFNTDLDNDGVIRAKRMLVRTGTSYFPSLSLKAYMMAKHQNAVVKIDLNPATGRREVTDFALADNDTGNIVSRIPTDGQGTLLINYAGPEQMFSYMSLADLVSDGDDAQIEHLDINPANGHWENTIDHVKKSEWMKDKIFVVGATAMGINDVRTTPFGKNFPGPETHANAISNLLTGNFMRPWEEERSKMPLVILVTGIVLSLTLAQVGAVGGLGLTVAFLGAFIFLDEHYLFTHGILIMIIWPLMMIGAVFVTMTFYRYFTEERGKKELRQTFQKYVSPAIVEEILSDPKNIELGGRKTNLTVFFSDVRGFTTISEKLDPRALSDLLNSYLTPMTEIVFRNRGTLDKYMGDAIMAFFGAPIGYSDHAKYACRCALQSLQKLQELQKQYEKKGLPSIDIGIGLNTGDVSVGNMGSETVRSYTVMGDAVNLASRLEGINKQYGTRVIMSEFTYDLVKTEFVCREVDWVRVKGKAQPVKIFELIEEGQAKGEMEEVLKHFSDGYLKYHEKSWGPAIESFNQALNIRPDDEVSKVYLTRCQEYQVEPPPDNWDGVFVMKTK